MSISGSPAAQLRAEAHGIAQELKRVCAGGQVANDPLGKIAAARARGHIEIGIVMDDKVIKLKVPLSKIEELALPLLCDFIYDLMRGGADPKEAN